jgi:hypothetical protein
VKASRVSWTFLLPIAELALWSALVLMPMLFLYGKLYLLQKYENPPAGPGQFEVPFPADRLFGFALATVCERRFDTIVNLNLPGVLLGAPVAVPAASYLRTHASGLSIQTWHTVTIPFFCLPVWWFAGLGIEGALKRKRLHWALRVAGSIFCCACVALASGILISPPDDRRDLLTYLPGAVLWAFAFGLFPLNLILTAGSRSNVHN